MYGGGGEVWWRGGPQAFYRTREGERVGGREGGQLGGKEGGREGGQQVGRGQGAGCWGAVGPQRQRFALHNFCVCIYI